MKLLRNNRICRTRCRLPSAFCPGATLLAIKRLQRSVIPASTLEGPPAADPQRRSPVEQTRGI
jgi:hypothetical protein